MASNPDPNANLQIPLVGFHDSDHDSNPDITDPYEGLPPLPDGKVWHVLPYNSLWLSDPYWFDSLGNSQIAVRRIFSAPSKSLQVDAALTLLEEFPTRGLDIMFAAAVKGKVHVIRALLNAGVKPHPVPDTDDDMSAVSLQAAAFNGHLDAVRVLIEEGGVGIDATDEIGGTALMRACRGRHPEIVRWLLEKGADPSLRQEEDPDEPGVRIGALEFAAVDGCLECVKLLLEWKPKEGAIGEDAGEGRIEITPLVLRAGAHSRSIEMVRFLMEKGGYPMDDVDGKREWKGERLSAEQRHNIQQILPRVKTDPGTHEFLLGYLARSDASGEYGHPDLLTDIKEES